MIYCAKNLWSVELFPMNIGILPYEIPFPILEREVGEGKGILSK